MSNLFLKEISCPISKHLEVEGLLCDVDIPRAVLLKIISQILLLSEPEPCGLRGATIVVLLSQPSPCDVSSEEDSHNVKIGRFKVDQTAVSTFELHLTLQLNHGLGLKLHNFDHTIRASSDETPINGRLEQLARFHKIDNDGDMECISEKFGSTSSFLNCCTFELFVVLTLFFHLEKKKR